MKKSHKKIGAIVLTGLAITGSGLSQGFVAHAGILNHNLLKSYSHNNMDTWDIFCYMNVKNNQDNYGYNAVYLGNNDEFIARFGKSRNGKLDLLFPKRDIARYYFLHPNVQYQYFLLKFDDEDDFLKGIEDGILNDYKHIKDGIIVKVGRCYFKFIFDLTDHERSTIPVKVLAQQFGFTLGYAESNSWYGNIVMESFLDKNYDFNKSKGLVDKLKETPSPKNTFKDPEAFADSLKFGGHIIPKTFTRYRIGDHDFILKK